ncbi:hypothetical protein KZ483_15915 [Paenibacillus sp. sptzw28]|nr:hypothetical protein [Paenibacillus sp. sptzw28]QYR19413.1 hypothetical protein KZ483_15915 [Paenibacillus sp. sptzw28]
MADRFDETVTVAVSAVLLSAIMLFYWINPVRQDGTETVYKGKRRPAAGE